jgi:serine-type D-Ala-D-Ala carboxypeptidase/endopeptidase (penicillin-binding protein 4)
MRRRTSAQALSCAHQHPVRGVFVRKPRSLAVAVLALLNVVTLAAGLTVVHMLPPRLALLHVPSVAVRPVVNATSVLAPVGGAPAARLQSTASPTNQGLGSMFSAQLSPGTMGNDVGIEVVDAETGQVLYSSNADAPATPASTTKLVTAVAALATLGPDARFSTTVRQVGGTVVLVGGGDPILAVNAYPSSDYPQPATLAQLAASTAKALKSQGHHSVRLGYDTSLYSGPDMAQGWSDDLVSAGDVTSIVSLEADQGRLTTSGALQDSDDPTNFNQRTTDPAGMTAAAFAALLAKDGITVTGEPAAMTAPASAKQIASVSSPPLSAIIEQMLLESNNVIAENLARHVAITLGLPATFAGAAQADIAELHKLGVTTPISLYDGSGLSSLDAIAPETLVGVLELASNTPKLRAVITGLPVAGFAGTLAAGDSDFGEISGAARGVVRAKTGNLATVATLAGLAYDKSGELLLFAIMADQIPSANQLPEAAASIDAAASGLAACGCS